LSGLPEKPDVEVKKSPWGEGQKVCVLNKGPNEREMLEG